ncbi:sel1 repeat family protein [Luteimonas sp. RIT-PG2_3]
MTSTSLRLLMLLVLAVASSATHAQTRTLPPDPTEDPLVIRAGFLNAHPDLRFRLLGLERMKQGKHEDALKFFMRAGFYADKPSQGMVAEMLWTGQGQPQDKALAYAWMDLAAERGYAGFLGLRERYWAGLDEAERERALSEGQALYARYGDAAAKPRIATVLRRERKRMTGSRTGFVGYVQILVPSPSGMEQIDGSKYYDPRYWDPDQYQQWHDATWSQARVGRVTVGEIQAATGPDLPPVQSRVPVSAPQTDAQEPEVPSEDEQPGETPRD